MACPVDSCPPPDSLRVKVKTPDLKTKTPEQSKQQKGAEITITSSEGESDSIAKGLDLDEMIERIDNILAPLIIGLDPTDQKAVDETLQ